MKISTSARCRPRPTVAAAGVAVAALLALSPLPAVAQQWSIEARGGELRYEGGPGLETSSAVAALRRISPRSSLLFSAGIPLSGADPLWAAVSGTRRLSRPLGPFTIGLDLAADAFGQKDRTAQTPGDGLPGPDLLGRRRPIPEEPLDGWGVSARALPLVGVGFGKADLQLRGGGAVYRSEFAGLRLDREVLQADARLSFAPTPYTLLSLDASRVAAEEDDYDRVGASLAFVRGPLTVTGSAGSWLEEGLGTLEWSAGAGLDVSDRVTLRLSARRDVFDPLYLTPERTSWGVGLSVKLGDLPRARAPVPASYEGGVATVVLDGEAAEDEVGGDDVPRIAGDFTDWKPVPMERWNGAWRYTARLEPGVYSYAFVGSDDTWFVPESHPGRKPDGFGGWTAVLVIEADEDPS